jgi:hypothetical protein
LYHPVYFLTFSDKVGASAEIAASWYRILRRSARIGSSVAVLIESFND